jgi:hypothetical protein
MCVEISTRQRRIHKNFLIIIFEMNIIAWFIDGGRRLTLCCIQAASTWWAEALLGIAAARAASS